MSTRLSRRGSFAIAAVIAMLLVASWPTRAQWWENLPTDTIPRTSDGAVDLSAPAPRTPDGRPDLSGIWELTTRPPYSRNLARDLDPDAVPFQAWARTLAEERADGSHSLEDPPASCLAQGVPRIGGAPAPWKIVQRPDLIVILYEAFTLWRQVFLDGRRLAAAVNPTWLGYSTGTWDGDTLLVDTRGFNGRAWLDQVGKPSTESLHVIERYRRTDLGHMDIEITIDDPGAYTEPWTITQQFRLLPDTELLEFICNENNRDLGHLPGASTK